jgi:hypothetical protein
VDVSLFTAINKLGKRSVMDVTESQANELAGIILSSESSIDVLADFISCYLPQVTTASLKTVYALHALCEPRLPILTSSKRLARLADAVAKFETVDFAFLFEISKRAAEHANDF